MLLSTVLGLLAAMHAASRLTPHSPSGARTASTATPSPPLLLPTRMPVAAQQLLQWRPAGGQRGGGRGLAVLQVKRDDLQGAVPPAAAVPSAAVAAAAVWWQRLCGPAAVPPPGRLLCCCICIRARPPLAQPPANKQTATKPAARASRCSRRNSRSRVPLKAHRREPPGPRSTWYWRWGTRSAAGLARLQCGGGLETAHAAGLGGGGA